MRIKKRIVVVSAIVAVGLGLGAYAFANPGVAACAAINAMPLARLANGTLVDAHTIDQLHPADLERLLSEARLRIENTFGTPRSEPIIVFFSDPSVFWPLSLNGYGSTQIIGSRTCVMVGPSGRNIDVVAHELLHAEIADRVGWWGRFTQLPVWFDEGLAMQVDSRPRYVLDGGADSETERVRGLESARDFFQADDARLTWNYAAAKAEVALWVAAVGGDAVYGQLERIRQGEPFEAVVPTK